MREMKDSGIQGVGMIPTDWRICKWNKVIKVLTDYTANGSFASLAKNVQYLDEPDYARLIRLTDLRTNLINKGVFVSEHSYNFLSKSALFGGEILIANVGANAGYTCEMPDVEYKTTLAPNMMLMKFDEKVVTRHFVYLASQSNYIQNQLCEMANKTTAQPKLNKDDVKSVLFVFPTIKNQLNICTYLDRKSEKIDFALNQLEKSIEKLKEYKQSLITEVVTKGLYPDVPMKDSGVEWIGEIPEMWSLVSLKRIGEAIIGLTYSPNDVKDSGVLVLRSSNIQNRKLTFDNNVFVEKEIKPNLFVRKNDLLICSRNGSRALIGKCALIKEDSDSMTFGAFMTIYRSKYNKFIYHVFNSFLFNFYIGSFLTSTINQLTTGNLNSMQIALPPKEEQDKIVEYLDKKCVSIDKAIEQKQSLIDKLTEYKKSLIYECVTGKVEV